MAEIVALFKRFDGADYSFLINNYSPCRFLPILSDPTEKDSDGDKINDSIDPEPFLHNDFMDFGSSEYMVDLIKRFENSNYYKYVYPYEPLHKNPLFDGEPKEYYDTLVELMIDDLDNSNLHYVVSDYNWNNFCEFFNYCIIRGGNITPKKHYIRNKLNRAPLTLKDMLKESDQWIL